MKDDASPTTAILRVDDQGMVVAANDDATQLLGPVVGRQCNEVVCARWQDVHMCRPGCAAEVARGEIGQDERGVAIRGRSARLVCSSVGDEAVVTIFGSARDLGSAPPLSHRECQVLALVARGFTTADAARDLRLSPATVRTHVENARRKLNARSRAEAVAAAVATGQIDL